MRYYVYVHLRADTREPFYVGKGCGGRAANRHGRSEHWNRIANKHGFDWDILHDNLTEDDAFRLEKEAIAAMPGLCNHTLGGEGVSGMRHTDAAKAAMSAARKGKKQNPIYVEARAAKMRGRKQRPEVIASRVNPMLGKEHSAETKAKMSAARTGKPRSPEAVIKTALANRGRKRSDEVRAKMSERQPKKAVRCVDTGAEFASLTSAADWLRANGHSRATKTGIWLAATGKYVRSYGYRWEYA